MSEPKTAAEILAALGKPFPKNAVKKRQGGGGRYYDYIETHAVINRLNAATNGEWSFIIRGYEWRGDLLMVHGELSIPPLGTRSAFGVQQVKGNAGEDLIKGGASDALKKCATQFGVALELYGSDYEAQPAPQDIQRPHNTSEPATPSQTPPPANIDHERAMKRLHAVGAQHGIDHEGLRMIVMAKATASGLSIASLNDAPGALLADTASAIEANPTKLTGWVAAQKASQAELMPSPDEVPNPDRFTN